MIHNLVSENYLRLNFTPKPGITPGTDDHYALNANEITSRYKVSVTPTHTTYCPRQNELYRIMDNTTLATVYTKHLVSDIAANSVHIGGVLTNYSAIDVLEFGICYVQSSTALPTINDSKVVSTIFTVYTYNGNTVHLFGATLENLTTRQLYRARAFVTTAGGTTYGPATSFDANYGNRVYVEDSVLFKPAVYALDEYYQGGRIFYIVGEGEYNLGYQPNIPHCYVVNTAPFAYDVPWGEAVVACQNATIAGYTDWDAVPVDTVYQLIAYKNAHPGRFLYPNYAYWTSEDAGTDVAYAYNLGTGTVFELDDDTLLEVLAQRFI